MRFGKRAFNDDDLMVEDGYYPGVYVKRSNVDSEPVIRDQRTPLGTMRFGKRSSEPFGTMRFGKREPENDTPFGTMRFGKRDNGKETCWISLSYLFYV